MKNNNTPAKQAQALTVTMQALKKYTKFVAPDGRVLAIAFPGKASVNVFFHESLTPVMAKTEGAAPKKNLETAKDGFEYRMTIRPQGNESPIEALKTFLRETCKANPEAFGAERLVISVPKPEAPAVKVEESN